MSRLKAALRLKESRRTGRLNQSLFATDRSPTRRRMLQLRPRRSRRSQRGSGFGVATIRSVSRPSTTSASSERSSSRCGTSRWILPKPTIQSRLVIRSVGIEKFEGSGIPEIKNANQDAEAIAQFLRAQGELQHFPVGQIDRDVQNTRTGKPAVSAPASRELFDRMKDEALAGKLQAGDTVFVLLESHVLDLGQETLILGSTPGCRASRRQRSRPIRSRKT